MRGQVEICGCFPTGRHYPGIADRLASARVALDVRGLASGFDPGSAWATASFAVIDFETTGLDPAMDRVLEMGVVCFDDGVMTASQNWLIDPTIPVPEAATAVHGITDEMLAGQPRFEQIWAEIRGQLEGACRSPTTRASTRSSCSPSSSGWASPRGASTCRRACRRTSSGSIRWSGRASSSPIRAPSSARSRRTSASPLDGAHRAANDAEATGRVLLAMSPEMPAAYAELVRVQVRYAAQQDVDLAIWRGRRF
ncbi:MAG: 3'-5' exonuclease [Sandaracinaceae bacterium]|nr:3'-5' exonuclease [Sandaracinaceae bacterium]